MIKVNKSLIVLTGLIGTTFALTGCSGGSPEEKVFNVYESTAKTMFEVRNDKELDNLVKNTEAKYQFIDFSKEIKDGTYAEFYEELFYGSEFIDEYAQQLKDLDISFKDQDIRCEKFDMKNFEIVSNPKLYIGDSDYLELENMYLVYNNEPIVVQNYNKVEKKVEETLEFIMPMILDSKGNVKAFSILEEEDRENVDEMFLNKNGIANILKDIEDLDSSLNDLANALGDLENESDEELEETQKETKPQVTDSKSYLSLSGLKFDIKDGEYATYQNAKTGLEIFVSFHDDKTESIDVDIPTSNIENIDFRKQLEIAMKRVGGNSKDINKLTETIKECLTEKYQQKSTVLADIEEYDGMYFVDVIDENNYEVTISIIDAGTHSQRISIEFMMYK